MRRADWPAARVFGYGTETLAVKAPRTVKADDEATPVNVIDPVAPRSCPVPPVICPGEMNATAVAEIGVKVPA